MAHTSSTIVGGDTDEEAEDAHDNNLLQFLNSSREPNLHLNADKLKLKMAEVPHIDHTLTSNGFCVDPKKAEAIEKKPVPQDGKAMQRLMG